MQAFTRLDAIAAALPIANVDTDKILAGRFLKTISREGLGDKLFWSLRQEPGFVLNRAPWNKAGILIALDNFGCGSSREHAPWALLDFGIRCVIAPGFADIFYNNCFKNGILPITLAEPVVRDLIHGASRPETARMIIDLAAQTIEPVGAPALAFTIDAGRKQDLLDGVDEIGQSLQHEARIAGFETHRQSANSWITEIDLNALHAAKP